MGTFVGLIIFLLSLGGAESFLKHLRSRRIQLRETNHKLSEADVLDLVKTIFANGAAPVGFGIFGLTFINTTNKEKNDKFEKLLVDAKAENKEKNDKLEKLLMDAQAAATRDMREHRLATTNAFKEHRLSVEISQVAAQAAATRDMRDHQLATANALEKMCTATQTVEKSLVAAQATNKEKNDKLEKLLVDAQAAATRDMRENQPATANALEKIFTATQTANALMVKDIDKLSGKT